MENYVKIICKTYLYIFYLLLFDLYRDSKK